MSGLAAGIRLAYFEKKVCILERHNRVGGLNSFYEIDGRKYDVGLHAMTNYVPKGTKGAPLMKILKQLRIPYDELGLCPQNSSAVSFPGLSINFDNDFESLKQDIFTKFPEQKENFEKLVEGILLQDETSLESGSTSAKAYVSSFLNDPLLVDMIFCPLMFYGSAKEEDMDLWQFVIMFKSIFMEGFSRPYEGVRKITKLLTKKYKECGGELRLGKGVKELKIEKGKAVGVILDNGDILEAKQVFSSAGYCETMELIPEAPSKKNEAGSLSFVEAIFTLSKEPSARGENRTIVFFNDTEKFHYRKPDTLMDASSGVICVPNNFQFEKNLPEGVVRITCMANSDMWKSLNDEDYQKEKKICEETMLDLLEKHIEFSREDVIASDLFTPKTITRFTSHFNGAVYGAPKKRKDAQSGYENLYLIGTDQGFLGITGALLSGISIANLYGLKN